MSMIFRKRTQLLSNSAPDMVGGMVLMRKTFKIVIASLLIIAGLITLPLPIPAGLLLLIVGLSLLVSAIPKVRIFLRQLRKRYQQTSACLNRLKPRLPKFARELIEDTDPDWPTH